MKPGYLDDFADEAQRDAFQSRAATTAEFLDAIKTRYKLRSDYALAKMLDVSHTRLSNWRRRGNTFDDAMAIKAAKLLGLHEGYVLNSIAAERARTTEARSAWERAARALAGVAVAFALVQIATLGVWDFPAGDQALAVVMAFAGNMHYANYAAALALAGLIAWGLARRRRKFPDAACHDSPTAPPARRP